MNISGSGASAGSSRRFSPVRWPAGPARASSTAAAAPVATSVCCGGRPPVRHRSDAERPGLREAAGRAAGRPGVGAVTSFLGRCLRSRHLVRRYLCVRRRKSGNSLEGDVPGAAPWRGAGVERRGAAGASRQPLDSRRRSAALYPLRPAPSSRAGGILGAAPYVYEFRDSSRGRGRAFLAASAAGAPRTVGQRDDRPGAACQPDARRPADTGVIRVACREHAAR